MSHLRFLTTFCVLASVSIVCRGEDGTLREFDRRTYLNFETLRKRYEYDPKLPLDAKRTEKERFEGGTLQKLEFRARDGIRVFDDVVVQRRPRCLQTRLGFYH